MFLEVFVSLLPILSFGGSNRSPKLQTKCLLNLSGSLPFLSRGLSKNTIENFKDSKNLLRRKSLSHIRHDISSAMENLGSGIERNLCETNWPIVSDSNSKGENQNHLNHFRFLFRECFRKFSRSLPYT